MDQGAVGVEHGVEEALGVLVGAEVDGPRRHHAHKVRTESLEQRSRAFVLDYVPEKKSGGKKSAKPNQSPLTSP